MKTGKVKFYNSGKGFGFIIPDEGGKDIFFHHTGTLEDVKGEDLVRYETEEQKKGLCAINVELC